MKDKRYNIVSRLLHWLMAIVFFFQCCFGFYMQTFDTSIRGIAYGVHKQLGMVFLGLAVFRVWHRYNEGWIVSKIPLWQKCLSKIVHCFLYLVMIAMPISGLLMSSYAGYPVSILGYKLILPVAKDKGFAEFFNLLHRNVSYGFYIMIILHISGFLYHALIKRDRVTKKMSFF